MKEEKMAYLKERLYGCWMGIAYVVLFGIGIVLTGIGFNAKNAWSNWLYYWRDRRAGRGPR